MPPYASALLMHSYFLLVLLDCAIVCMSAALMNATMMYLPFRKDHLQEGGGAALVSGESLLRSQLVWAAEDVHARAAPKFEHVPHPAHSGKTFKGSPLY
jgi:hypothetical protein